jgi:tryptophan-rich sensory protein
MAKGNKRQSNDLIGTAAICGAVAATAALGSLSGDFESAWYRQLRKPEWQPSRRVIGAVWSVLYTLTATAGILLWRRRSRVHGDKLLWLFALQLGLNAAFTPILTRLRALKLATAICGMLSLVVATLAVLAWPVRRLVAVLLVPYVLWTAFATLLSWRIQRLNREA